MKYLAIILLTLTISKTNTCNNKTNTTADNGKITIQEPKKNTYSIITLNGKDVTQEKLHITFDEEQHLISGYSGCNTFTSKYTMTNDQISLGLPIASKIYCEKKMALEEEFFKALFEIKTKTISDKNLSLKDPKGKELLSGKIKN